MKIMTKTLLFQSALPVYMAIICVVVLHFSGNPFVAVFAAALAALLGVALTAASNATSSMVSFDTRAVLATAPAAALAAAFTAVFATVLAAAFAAVFSTAFVLVNMKNLDPTNSIRVLTLYNLLWTGAIGLAVYFVITADIGSASVAALAVAVGLPLLFLAYKTWEKRSTGAERAEQETPAGC